MRVRRIRNALVSILLLSLLTLMDFLPTARAHPQTRPVLRSADEQIAEPLRAFGLGDVLSVAFSPDGERALLGSGAGFAVLVDVESGTFERYLFGHTDAVGAVAFSPDGTKALTGSDDRTAKLWDLNTGEVIQTFTGHTARLTSVAFSPDGTEVLTGSEDHTARLWNASDGSLIRTFTHTDYVNAVAFSPDGTEVLTGSSDETAKLWNGSTGDLIRTFDEDAPVTSVAFSPDGSQVLVGDSYGYAKLWDASTGDLVRSVRAGTWYLKVAFSPDGSRFLSGDYEGDVKLWETSTGDLVHTFAGHDGQVTSVAFSPNFPTDNRLLSGSYDSTAKLWDASTGDLVRAWQGFGGGLTDAAVSPDGATVALADGTQVWLMDAVTGDLLRTFTAPDGYCRSVDFSPDGLYLAGGCGNTILVWDAVTGQTARSLDAGEWIEAVAYSPDGNKVLAGTDSHAQLWDVTSGNLVCTLENGGHVPGASNSVAFSPDGSQALTGNTSRRAYLWDLSTCTKAITLTVGGTQFTSVRAVAFSSDGSQLLTGSSFEEIGIWNAADGSPIRTLTGHADDVNSVAYSPDGSHVLSGSRDKTARLWDASTGDAVRRFEGHGDSVNTALLSPDQSQVLTASDDGTARLWDSGLRPVSPRRAVTLTLGTEVTGTAFVRRYADYVLTSTVGSNLLVQVTPLDGATPWVYGRFGDLPSLGLYDVRALEPSPDGKYYLSIAPTLDGAYYFSVFDRDVSAQFRILARHVDRFLADVSPRSAGNGGRVTLSLRGLGFTEGITVALRGPETVTSTDVTLLSPTEAWAEFDLTGATPGTYDVYAVWPGGQEEGFAGAFQVTAGTGPDLTVSLDAPEFVRKDRTYGVQISYASVGDADVDAPLFIVSSDPSTTLLRTLCEGDWVSGTVQVLGVNPSGPAGTLPPGLESGVSVLFRLQQGDESTFRLYRMEATDEQVDWDAYKDRMRPEGLSSADWDALWPTLKANLGTTWADYLQVLREDAERLRRRGQINHCVRDLLALEVEKAQGRPAAIAGRLLNAETGEPLGGAVVAAYESGHVVRTDVTDPLDGRFLLTGLSDGTYELKASQYEITPTVTVEITNGLDVTGLTLFARPGTGLVIEEVSYEPPRPNPPDIDDEPQPPIQFLREETSYRGRSLDPNEKVGPQQPTVAVSDTLHYTVYFENQPSATAPAQEVVVVDYLDPDLDWSTFRFEEVAFGDTVIPIGGSLGFHVRRAIPDYRETVTKTWWVDVVGEFNPDTGRVQWTFRTLDPDTGDLPEDALAGFLPPDDDTGRGEGHVAFSVRPRSDAANGTEITNRATIVFDTEEAIPTNEVKNVIGQRSEIYLPLVLRNK